MPGTSPNARFDFDTSGPRGRPFPKSAFAIGGAILECYGQRFTYLAALSLAGRFD